MRSICHCSIVVASAAALLVFIGCRKERYGETGLPIVDYPRFGPTAPPNAPPASTATDSEVRDTLALMNLSRTPQALNQAAKDGNIYAVQLLLKAGVDPNVPQEGGLTPLMNAGCFTDVLRALVEAGADVNARANVGNTAVFRAVVCRNAEGVALLLEAGADVTIRTAAGETVWDFAARDSGWKAGDEAVRRLLRDAGAR